MADGFGFTPVDYLVRAQARLPLDPNAPDQSVQPAARPSTAPAASPQAPAPYKPSFWDVLQGVVFDGQSPAEAAMAARGRAYSAQQQAIMMDTLRNADPQIRMAMMLNPAELGKALADRQATHTLKGGETGVNMGTGGAPVIAPLLGFDTSSGRGYSVGAGGALYSSGPQIPGDYSAKDGVIVSGRTGVVANRYSLPQMKPLGSSLEDFTPSVGISTGGAGATGQYPSGGQGAQVQAGVPRGIRNLNFGNLRSLSNGQQWSGQTGVDKDGYAIFGSPEAGVVAAAKNLQSYAAHGVNTPAAIAARWAPAGDGANDPKAYAGYIAGQLGVHPNDKIDLTDPGTQKKVLGAIFGFENGPQAMNAWRWPNPVAQSSGDSGAQVTTLVPAQRPRPLTDPEERASFGISPQDHTPYVLGPEGPKSIGSDVFSPERQLAYAQAFMGSAPYKDYVQLRQFHDAAQLAMNQQGGPADLQILDMALKSNNPTLGVRPNQVDQMMSELGLPNKYTGQVRALVQNGQALSPEARKAMSNVIDNQLQASWTQLQPLVKKADRDAQRYGLTRDDLVPGLIEPPSGPDPRTGFGPASGVHPVPTAKPSYSLPPGVPPPAQRKPGLYNLPNGPAVWDGSTWHKMQSAH